MEKHVARVLHDSRSHRAGILLNTGRASRLSSLVEGKKGARGRWKLILSARHTTSIPGRALSHLARPYVCNAVRIVMLDGRVGIRFNGLPQFMSLSFCPFKLPYS